MSNYSIAAKIFSPAELTVSSIEYYNQSRPPAPDDEYITMTSTSYNESAVITQEPVTYGKSDSQGRPIHALFSPENSTARAADYELLTDASGMSVSISSVGSSNVTIYPITYKTPEDQLVKRVNRTAISLYPGYGTAPGYIDEAGGTVTEDDVVWRTIPSPFKKISIRILRPVWYQDEYLNLFHMVYADGEFTFEWGEIEETTNTTIWKQDSNNDGYPWIWGWTEDPRDKASIKYLKTENGLMPIRDYLKTEDGFIGLQDYLKVDGGLVKC